MHIQGQSLLEIILDLDRDQSLEIDVIDAAQRIDDRAWVFEREGLGYSMVLRLNRTIGFCDFGDEERGLKPVWLRLQPLVHSPV